MFRNKKWVYWTDKSLIVDWDLTCLTVSIHLNKMALHVIYWGLKYPVNLSVYCKWSNSYISSPLTFAVIWFRLADTQKSLYDSILAYLHRIFHIWQYFYRSRQSLSRLNLHKKACHQKDRLWQTSVNYLNYLFIIKKYSR